MKKSPKKISKKSLREHIGIVPQDIILFNDTVKNNISYGFENPNIADNGAELDGIDVLSQASLSS